MTMGERIRSLRKEHRMSMEELGKYLGVGKSAILKYEKGEVENLPRSTIEKLAILFGVSPSYIMCFDEWEKNSQVLSDEVMLIERIQAKWGKNMIEIMRNFSDLNEDGQQTLIEIAESFTLHEKYKKQDRKN